MPILTSGPFQSSNQYITAQVLLTYTITDTEVIFSNIKLQLHRTNSNYTGTATHGSCNYYIYINGKKVLEDGNTEVIYIPNNGSWVTIVNSNIDERVNFNNNSIISVPLRISYSMPQTTLAKTSLITETYTFKRIININTKENPIETSIATWFPTSYGQCNSNNNFDIVLSMQAAADGYLYVRNNVDNRWYIVSTNKINANTWVARKMGNGNNPIYDNGGIGGTRLYSFHVDNQKLVDNINTPVDSSITLTANQQYSIYGPYKIYNLIISPNEKWRIGVLTQNTSFFLQRPDDVPTNSNGYTLVNGASSFNDPSVFKYVYLSNTLPPAEMFKCPNGDSSYEFYGFNKNSGDYALSSNMKAGEDSTDISGINDNDNIYAIFKRLPAESHIGYFVDGQYIKSGSKSYPARYYYGGGSYYPATDTPTYSEENYIPTKEGYSFSGWSTDPEADNIDYETGKDALDAGFEGRLYAVWKVPFGIFTSPSSSANLGTITGQIIDVFGNTIEDSFTNVTSFGMTDKDPGIGYRFTVNKNSNVDKYTIKIFENEVEVESYTFTSNTTFPSNSTYKYIKAKNTRVVITWQNNIIFNYGASNGSSITVTGDIKNINRTQWTVKTPIKQANLTGSWEQIGWIPTVAVSITNKVNYNETTTVTSTSYYALYSRILEFYSGEPDSNAIDNIIQYRCGGTYSQPTTPTPQTIDNWNTKIGWRTDITTGNSGTVYNSATAITYTANSPLTFYAIYSRPITFNYFSTASATTKSTGTRTQYLNSGNSTPSSVTSYALYTQSSYNWAPIGWRIDNLAKTNNSNLGQTGTTTISITPSYDSDDTIYNAIYCRTPQFTYNANGGSSTPSATIASSYQYYNANNDVGSTIRITTAAAISKSGSTFTGWALDSQNGTSIYGASKSVKFPSITWTSQKSRELWATWNRNTSAITLDAQGGIGGIENTEATYGSAMPSISSLPSYAGHVFLGYYDAETDGIKYYNTDGTSAKNWDKEGAQTLYAQWQFRGMYVFRNGEWRKVVPYVYNGSEWKETIPYVYSGSAWKQA